MAVLCQRPDETSRKNLVGYAEVELKISHTETCVVSHDGHDEL